MDLAHDLIIKWDSVDLKERKNMEGFIYLSAKNLHIQNLRRERYCDLTKPPVQEDTIPLVDPFEYIERINSSDLDEIEKLWLTTYLDFEGKYCSIAREINISRQTISKKIREACQKLKN